MSAITQQVHTRFKMFAGALQTGPSIAHLAKDVEDFAVRANAAGKSIGIEYLEHSKTVVITFGYRNDETPYPIKLQTVALGRGNALDPADLTRLESRMEEEASRLQNIICHELLVTEKDDFVVVFMTHHAA
jgi:hypothetical protein